MKKNFLKMLPEESAVTESISMFTKQLGKFSPCEFTSRGNGQGYATLPFLFRIWKELTCQCTLLR